MTFVKITMDPPSTGSGQAAQNTAVMTLGFLIKYQTSNLLMLLTLLYLLTNTSLWAADTLKVERPHPVNEPWRWTEFDRTSGLAGRVRSIYEDRDGNIWFATDRGAQRYDGRTWTTYTTEDGLGVELGRGGLPDAGRCLLVPASGGRHQPIRPFKGLWQGGVDYISGRATCGCQHC